MMTKEEMLSDIPANFDAFFRQFVTDEVKMLVENHVGRAAIQASPHPQFKDIALTHWSKLHEGIYQLTHKKIVEAGDMYSLPLSITIARTAAQMIREEAQVSTAL